MSKFKDTSGTNLTDYHHLPILNRIISLPRYTKRAILFILDFFILCFALWISFCLRLGIFYVPTSASLFALLLLGPATVVLSFHYNGLYKLITRFAGRSGALKIVWSISFAILVWCLIIYMSTFGIESIHRSVIVMFGLFSVLFIWGMRSFISFLLRDYIPFKSKVPNDEAIPVLVYGVGELGNQLFNDLMRSKKYKLVGFIDDNQSLWRQILHGLRVYSPDDIVKVVTQNDIKEIFLADTSINRHRKRELVNLLTLYSVQVKTLPAHHEIASGKVQISDLRNIGIEDLLGRALVPPVEELLNKNVRDKCVMITGAGGSIGSEITRQVAKLLPSKIILFEHSELALYEIEHELRTHLKSFKSQSQNGGQKTFEIISILGSVLDDNLVRNTIKTHQVNTLYHAAAYKHVPIVEENPYVGLKNNIFGTLETAKAANDLGVELFVLISTDKAVRPTNVMGASKRIAELCLQALAAQSDTKTIFTMVRFGNVLGSSGSVVGRFREQIKNGGPITVTHPEIIRYFMMIPEAAQLVIQAGSLASGGDVFVLDMGQPIKIVDLAKSMVNLSGLEVIDENNPDGDIAIEYIGLREGEKLFEELLISENSSPTVHKSIIKNNEEFFPFDILQKHLDTLNEVIKSYDKKKMYEVLSFLVEDYAINAETRNQTEPYKQVPIDQHINELR